MTLDVKLDSIEGWLSLDKESGISSFGALKLLKRKFGVKKAGYVGTLDPIATGVLVIALGRTTKLIPQFDDSFKEYEFAIEWGAETDTLDSEGAVLRNGGLIPSTSAILGVLPSFLGEQLQVPPKFSAIHVNGHRAYSLARAGIEFNMQPRRVVIHSIECMNHSAGQSTLKVSCSKGTYVRALARDIARKLESLAFVSKIRRTRSGIFNVTSGNKLSEITKEHIVPPSVPLCRPKG
ncbi:tRNA pseudouridine(55) synthase TruB [Neorickettsia sennetsu]|uniref:tRNA pseudouridine synthase B n=1 Tax=Ehrlichia sennetsu (strain ATCC VR-367 / Miyayama) TaxID=222891 RepID=Q2GEU5_EHRS3|nr:tRNA pseudouridine(55) synthase TruB [Neorickettsia sennetsu]ABD46307.1 tRNA pseudouridine synthase B [Neorickettsia sennetsu str. Miyayama]